MNVEFGIHGVESISSRNALITGRVFKGSVRCGGHFDRLYRVDLSTPNQTPLRQMVGEIDLVVTRIVCYGRAVNEIEEGLTACIEVSGDGIGGIKPMMSIGA